MDITAVTPGSESTTTSGSLKKEFSFWSTLALAFGFVSPIVALYTIFGLALTSGGAAFWWGFLIAIGFQFLVALVFAELVSVWPLAGGVYQWTRALLGRSWGWFTGWIYTWTLISGLGAVSYSGGIYLAALFGIDAPTPWQAAMFGLGIMAAATLANTIGRKAIKLLIAGSIAAEIVGSILLGTYLLIWHRNNDYSVILSSQGVGGDNYMWGGAFAAVMALVGFSFFGFESAGSIAEEVRSARKVAPRAMIAALLLVGLVVIYSAFALIISMPDLLAVVSGAVGDPVVYTVVNALGDGVAKPLFLLFVIGFMAAAVAIQAGASRVVFGLARDNALPASSVLKKLSTRDGIPVNAVSLVGVLVVVMYLFSGSSVHQTLINFCAGGFFLTFLLPTFAALVTKLTGRWSPGSFSLGKLSLPINIVAAVWLVIEGLNVAWPRLAEAPWYINYAVPTGAAVVIVFGAVFYLLRRSSMTDYNRVDMKVAAAVVDDD